MKSFGQSPWPIGVIALLLIFAAGVGFSQAIDGIREWTDSSGKFKIVGEFQELVDGVAFIRQKDGKLLKIPLTRLCESDRKLLSIDANPFAEANESELSPSASKRSAPAHESATEGTVPAKITSDLERSTSKPVDWSSVKRPHLSKTPKWNLGTLEKFEFDFEPAVAVLKPKLDHFEKLHPLVVNPICKRAVVGRSQDTFVPIPKSRISMIDLPSGRVLESESFEANVLPLAITNDGSGILMVGRADGNGRSAEYNRGELQLWKFKGNQLFRHGTWEPYLDESVHWSKKVASPIQLVEPIDEAFLLTMSDKKHLVVWRWPELKPVWHLPLSASGLLAMSQDKQIVYVVDGNLVSVLKSSTGEVIGTSTVPATSTVTRLATSPDDRRLYVVEQRILTLDLTNGKWLESPNWTTEQYVGSPFDFPDRNYCLVAAQTLVHIPSGISVCRYSQAIEVKSLGGTTFALLDGQEESSLVACELPHDSARLLLGQVENDPKAFALKPGDKLSIDVSGIDSSNQAEIETSLGKAIESSVFALDVEAPISAVATLSKPVERRINLRDFAVPRSVFDLHDMLGGRDMFRGRDMFGSSASTFPFQEIVSKVDLRDGGQVLWSSSLSNVPLFAQPKSGESAADFLDKKSNRPNLTFFEQVRFPNRIVKPNGSIPRRGDGTTLIQAKFTAQGFIVDE